MLMSEIIFKRSMNIGSISAESDAEFLDECFIKTPEYEELIDFQNTKMILLGRTGSGKTALLKKIKNDADKYIEIKPGTFAMQYISSIPFVSKLIDDNVNLDIFYKFLWLHEIISQIIKNYFAYDKRDFLKELSEKVSDYSRVSGFKKYLNEYEGIFFDEGSTEKITKEVEKEVLASLGIDNINLAGKLSDKQIKEVQIKASQYINKKQIKQLKNIITIFGEYFSINRQKKIIVVIDNLDENWVNDETKYRLIDALLNAIREFANIPNLKILIAMRADLLTKTCETTKRQNEKDESFTLRLNWTKKMIEELLDKRIKHLFTYKYKKNASISFNDLFNIEIDGVKASEYIINRTMMRPRDAISFVNYCIQKADKEIKITIEHILEAENDFKNERFKALDHEWSNVYGDIDTFFQLLSKLGDNFKYKELILDNTYKDIEIIIYHKSKKNNYLAEKFFFREENDEYIKEANIKELLNVMFTIGLIGIKNGNRLTFATPNHSTLTALDFSENLEFEVYPLFKRNKTA